MMRVLKVDKRAMYAPISQKGELAIAYSIGEQIHVLRDNEEISPCGKFAYNTLGSESKLWTIPGLDHPASMCEICKKVWVVSQLGE